MAWPDMVSRMKNILFTGVTSFSGFYFVKKMSENKNFRVFCILTKNRTSYDFLRKKRIDLISKKKNVHLIFNIKFGDRNFIKLLKKVFFNIICFHHSYTKNFSSDKKFNFLKSLKENLNNVEQVFNHISKKSTIIISNSYFQKSLKKKYNSFSKYGTSKDITYETYKQFCNLNRIKYKSIFINNPWGVLEGKKLNYYLIKSWFEQRKTIIKYPLYIRDNINIEQLSKKYNKIVLSKSLTKEYYPTGYCSSNKVFVEALRGEFEKFFKIKTKVKYLKNSKYNEPLIRTNSKKITKKVKFKEKLDDYFKYYYDLFKRD